jgi:hypothetical protein
MANTFTMANGAGQELDRGNTNNNGTGQDFVKGTRTIMENNQTGETATTRIKQVGKAMRPDKNQTEINGQY